MTKSPVLQDLFQNKTGIMKEGVTLLIVDDDETFCRFLAEMLETKGMSVDWTTDPLQGYGMSQRERYDLFIFDVRMPLIVGTELVDDIRVGNPKAKIILISAFADEALRRLAQKLGVSLLSKPFSQESLIEEIENTLRQPD